MSKLRHLFNIHWFCTHTCTRESLEIEKGRWGAAFRSWLKLATTVSALLPATLHNNCTNAMVAGIFLFGCVFFSAVGYRKFLVSCFQNNEPSGAKLTAREDIVFVRTTFSWSKLSICFDCHYLQSSHCGLLASLGDKLLQKCILSNVELTTTQFCKFQTFSSNTVAKSNLSRRPSSNSSKFLSGVWNTWQAVVHELISLIQLCQT